MFPAYGGWLRPAVSSQPPSCSSAYPHRFASADVSGTVVDQSGRAVPRAYVRALDSSGVESAGVFADEVGRFELKTTLTNCRVEASLTGFQPASTPCASAAAEPVRLVLNVAPIQETTIVTATRTDAPTQSGRCERNGLHR